MIVSLYQGKRERGLILRISVISMVRKIYTGILVDKICRVNEGLIDNKQGDFI